MDRTRQIVVTGSAGYLGSALVLALERAEYLVTGVDDLSRGTPERAGYARTFARLDIRDRSAIEALLRNQKPDVVVHLAGRWHAPVDQRAPEVAAEINIGGTAALLGAVRACEVPRVLIVHGLEQKPGEAEVTRIVDDCRRAWDLDAVVARVAEVGGADLDRGVGEDQTPFETRMHRLMRTARRANHELDLEGGRAVDLIHLLDAADGLVATLRAHQQGKAPHTVDVCRGELTPLAELAERLAELTGREMKVRAGEAPAEPTVSGDPSVLERIGGWTVTRGIDDVLRDAWAFDSERRAAVR